MLWDGVWLGQFPSCPYVNDGLDNGFAFLVHESERRALVGDREGELVFIHQADLFDFGGIVNVVQENRLAQDPRALCGSDLHGSRANLRVDRSKEREGFIAQGQKM